MPTNPFVIGQWVRGEKFYGRNAQIEEILHGPRNWIWLLGTRRIGKTSLLKQLEYLSWEAQERVYFPLFWDFQGADSVEELTGGFNEALLDAEERLEELGIEYDDLESDDLFRSLAKLRRKVRSANLKLFLLCDEVEELIKLHKAEPKLLRKLRRAMQSQEDCRSVLASTIRLWELVDERTETSPFLHGFTPPMYISGMTDVEARQLITQQNLTGDSRPAFDPDIAEDLRRKCDNHPYLMQLVCKRFLESGDFQSAVEQVSVDQMVSYFFSVDMEMLTSVERDVLRVIAESSASTSGSLVERVGMETGQLSGILLRLEQLGYVRRNDTNQFELVNHFFRRWFMDGKGARMREGSSSTSQSGTVSPEGEAIATESTEGTRTSNLTTQSLEVQQVVLNDRYHLTQQLGEGATGAVYKASDGFLGKTVAIKVLKAEYCANPEMLERFRREILASRDLGHPNILKVYDIGRCGDDWYLAMKLVEGPTLSEMIRQRGALEAPLSLRIGCCLAAALEAAHGEGIIHRDIKPSNILMDRNEQPFLADFGLARLSLAPGLTRAGAFLGTPDYASPEQARLEPPDERSDLYSLGVVMFEMFTGDRPFHGESVHEVLQMHRDSVPPTPSEVRPGIPFSVSMVILRCLEKDPAQRYQTAGALRRALEALS